MQLKPLHSYILFASFWLMAIVVNVVVWHYITVTVPDADTNLAARNIETPAKLLLNGYLGTLFGFRYLGSINWLVLPLGVLYCIVVRPKLTKAVKAFVLFLLLAFILIALKGYFNPRYQMTLLPIFIFLVFYLNWDFYEKLKQPLLKYLSTGILVLFVLFNFYQEVFGSMYKKKLNAVMQTQEELIQQDAESENYTENLLTFIDSMDTESYFLVNNLPDFFYATSQKGRYYWCGDDLCYTSEGKRPIFSDRTSAQAATFLVDTLHCRFVYTIIHYSKYNSDFDDFIEHHCKLVMRDEARCLYEIISDEE